MREIKVRGFSKGYNKWIYGWGVVHVKLAKEFAKEVGKDFVSYIYNDHGNYEVVTESVGEFAGLKDKNGREIYEGNLILIHQWNRKYEVIFESGMFKAKGNTRFSLCTATNGELTCEVIGNIYENQELLEGAK